MAILIWPLAQQRRASSASLIAISIAVSWAAGTVYVKWARMTGDPVANAAWQIVIAFVIVIVSACRSSKARCISRRRTSPRSPPRSSPG